MFNWTGALVPESTGIDFTIAPHPTFSTALRGPFNFNPVGAGQSNGTSIMGIDAARNPIVNVLWLPGQPEPTDEPILTQGNNQYYQTFRFTVTIPDPTSFPWEIHIHTVGGMMQAIAGFTQLGSTEPDEDIPGQVTWSATSFVTDTDANASFTIRLIPAPGAAALLGLGGLMAARRRR